MNFLLKFLSLSENDPKQKSNKQEIAAKNLLEEDEAKMKKVAKVIFFLLLCFSIADFAVLLTEKPIYSSCWRILFTAQQIS